MKQMLAFTNTKVTKDQLLAVLEKHKDADAFVQNIYYMDGKGCAVGCSLHDFGAKPDDHAEYEPLFGIPMILAVLEDRLFEGLEIGEAKKWPLRFTAAIEEGADLSQVYPQFQRWLLIDPDYGVIRFAKTDQQRKVIQDSADLYLDWPNVDREKALLVRDASASAADAYAHAVDAAYGSAAYAAYADSAAAYPAAAAATDSAAYTAAAADAGDAARKDHYYAMSNKLIELIKAAPVPAHDAAWELKQ